MEFLTRCFAILLLTVSSAQAGVPGFSVGTNTTFANGGSEQPFLDILKAGIWNTRNNSDATTPEGFLLYQSFLDSNGYPTTLTGGPTHTFTRVSRTVLSSLGSSIAPFTYYQAGDYLWQWTGTQQGNVSRDATVTCSSTASPCAFTVSSPSANGLQLEITSTGAGAAYGRNWSLVYCGTWNGTHCSNGADTQIAACQAGTYSQCFNPQWVSRMTGMSTFRPMHWALGSPSEFNQLWANRKAPTWYSYSDSNQSALLNGDAAGIQNFTDGVPVEIVAGACNALNADCWFNIPADADDNFVTQFATVAHTVLNSNLHAYVEYSNELWNFVQANGQTGEITAKIDDGSGGAGNILTVSVIGPDGSTPILHAPLVIGGLGLPTSDGRPTTQIISQTGGTTGGTGTYTVTAPALLNVSSETMTVNVNVVSNLDNMAAANFSGLPPNSGASLVYSQWLRPVQVAHLFKAAWGADSGRVFGVAGGQNGCSACTQGSLCILTALPTGAHTAAGSGCSGGLTGWGGPTFWYGSTGGALATLMDGFAIAPYWAYSVPVAWTNDPDGGLQSFFTEAINSGLEPTTNVTGNCGNGAGLTCDPVDSAHFTLTTGKSLSSDPVNGTMFMAKMNATNTSSGSQTFLTVDSMVQYPIMYNTDNCPGQNVDAGILPVNQEVVFIFTNAFNGCTGGSITKGWRAMYQQYNVTPGMINDAVNGLASATCTDVGNLGGGMPLLAYEGGQDFDQANSTTSSAFVIMITNAMRDARMGYAYEKMYREWKNLTGCTTGAFVQFDDIEAITLPSQFEWWGLLENVLNTSSPRYDATINFTKGNPGGRLNFLLNRDFNPASNDNSPAFLNKAA